MVLRQLWNGITGQDDGLWHCFTTQNLVHEAKRETRQKSRQPKSVVDAKKIGVKRNKMKRRFLEST